MIELLENEHVFHTTVNMRSFEKRNDEKRRRLTMCLVHNIPGNYVSYLSSHHLGRMNLGAPDSALSCGLVRAQLVPTSDPAQDWIDVFCTRYKMIADRDQSRAFQESSPAGARTRIQPRRRSEAIIQPRRH